MRKLLAAGLLALAITSCATTDADKWACYGPTEDTALDCQLDPTARYDYGADGVWRTTDRASAPTGAEVMRRWKEDR